MPKQLQMHTLLKHFKLVKCMTSETCTFCTCRGRHPQHSSSQLPLWLWKATGMEERTSTPPPVLSLRVECRVFPSHVFPFFLPGCTVSALSLRYICFLTTPYTAPFLHVRVASCGDVVQFLWVCKTDTSDGHRIPEAATMCMWTGLFKENMSPGKTFELEL